ncbi:MAG: radical SAM protein [Elusimicrobia bacterium]|nr:radical SAM protein [Elusimicrobiota bacterium]
MPRDAMSPVAAAEVSKVRKMAFEFFYSCAQHCVFCSSSESLSKLKNRPYAVRDVCRVLVQKRRLGVDRLMLVGSGEPLLHPGILTILGAAKKLGMRTFVITNGAKLSEPAFARHALALLDELCLSIHGDDAALHDRLTRAPGAFRRSLKALERIRSRAGVSLMTNTVVCMENRDRVERIIEFLAGQGVERCQLANVAPEGRAGEAFRKLAVPLDWWRAKVPLFARLARERGVTLTFDGLPLCVLGPRRGASTDVGFIPVLWVKLSMDDGALRLSEELRTRETRDRAPIAACAGCAEIDECGWVFTRYTELFGTAELKPIRRGGGHDAR